MKLTIYKSKPFTLLCFLLLPFLSKADGFKFKIKNTDKTAVSVFCKITKKSGKFKLKPLVSLKAGEERIKDVSVSKGDTIAFYGQDAEDETSIVVKRDFTDLE